MRALKNWTITAESLKGGRDGFIAYYQYLKSNGGKHQKQTITELTNRRNAVKLIRTADAFNLVRKLTKGGRPSNYGWSATFSYPFDLTIEQMRLIYTKNMAKFLKFVSDYNHLQFSDEEIQKLIHDETVAIMHSGYRNNGQKLNNHLHMIIPKHFRALNSIQVKSIDLTHKRYLKAIKAINNATVYEVLELEVFDYQVKSKTERKKRLTATQYSFERVAEQVDEAQILLDEINAHIKAYKEWANETESHDEEVPKELGRALKQLQNGNTERAKKSLHKFVKDSMDR